MGAGIASLLWSATQFCIINRPASGEHLGESIKAIINPPSFSTGYKPDAPTTLHTLTIITPESRR